MEIGNSKLKAGCLGACEEQSALACVHTQNLDEQTPVQLQGAPQSLSAMILQLHGLLSMANPLAVQCQPNFVRVKHELVQWRILSLLFLNTSEIDRYGKNTWNKS